MCVREQRSRHLDAALIRMVGSQIGLLHGRDSCKHLVPAGDLVGVIRQVVVDWPVANRPSAFRRLSGNKRCRVRAEDVLSLAEERDHRQQEGRH